MRFHRNCVVAPASRRLSGMRFHRNFVLPETGAGSVGLLAGSHLAFASRLAIACFRLQRDPRDLIRTSLDGLEDARRAHAGPDAHRDHAELLFPSSQAVHERCRANRTGGAERMPERNRAALGIHAGRV